MFDYRINLDLCGDYSAGETELNPHWSNPGDLYKIRGVELSDDYSENFTFALIVNDITGRVWIDVAWSNRYFDESGIDVTFTQPFYPNGYCGNGRDYRGIKSVKSAIRELLQNLQWLNEKDFETVKKTALEAFKSYMRYYWYGVKHDVTDPLTI